MPVTRARNNQLAENSHSGYKHHDTSTETRVLGACEFLDAKGIKGQKASVFRQFNVGKTQGWQILREGRDRRRLGVEQQRVETRGRPPSISSEDLHRMERIIEDCDVEGRSMSWDTLAYESGLDVSPRTIQRATGTLNYYKCIACRKGWVNKVTALNRIEYAKLMKARYPHQDDWKRVRFSDETYIGLGPQGQLYIIRKPRERYCIDCIQHADEPAEQDKKKLPAWAAIRYSFKSPLIPYNIKSNTNGKMTQKAYINQILDPIVKPWIQHHNSFVLEEDRDSGHGTSEHNIVRDWKKQNRLISYFNCASSPDLAPIENAWAPIKQYVRKYAHWDTETTEELTQEGWDSVKQRYINKQVLSMLKRLQDVIEADGAMTGW
jgi:hypothetical protein